MSDISLKMVPVYQGPEFGNNKNETVFHQSTLIEPMFLGGSVDMNSSQTCPGLTPTQSRCQSVGSEIICKYVVKVG